MKKLLIAIILAMLMIPSIALATNINSCTNLNSADTYTLTQNIVDTGTSPCMDITSSDVILDCQNYQIDSNNRFTGIAIKVNSGLDNITVRNCDLYDWEWGIVVEDSTTHDIILEHLFIKEVTFPITIDGAYDFEIYNLTTREINEGGSCGYNEPDFCWNMQDVIKLVNGAHHGEIHWLDSIYYARFPRFRGIVHLNKSGAYPHDIEIYDIIEMHPMSTSWGVLIEGGYNVHVHDAWGRKDNYGWMEMGTAYYVYNCNNCTFDNVSAWYYNLNFDIYNSTDIDIVNSKFSGTAEWMSSRIRKSSNVKIHHSDFDIPDGYELFGWWIEPDCENITIEDNNITHISYELRIQFYVGGKYNLIQRNEFRSNWYPFGLLRANYSRVINNLIDQDGAYIGVTFNQAYFNEYTNNTHVGTPEAYDLRFLSSHWNYGYGNVLNFSNVDYQDSFNNTITDGAPELPPEPDFNYTNPKDTIIHFVKSYPYETPYCVNCEVQNGNQRGVVFYQVEECKDVNYTCEVFNYYQIPVKLITVDNDVCSVSTNMSACGIPTNWKAHGKATWVFHDLGNDTQPLISKYSDALGVTTEFDTTTDKHKIIDEDGTTYSESDDVFVAQYEITNSYMKFWIANDNPKTIWADEIYIPNQVAWQTIQYLDGAYTTHNKKTVDIQFELDTVRDLIKVTPLNANEKIPIETASGSNELEINCMHETCTMLSDIGVGLGGFFSAIYMPIGNLLLILGVISGVVAIFMTIAYAIKRWTSF